MAQARTGLLRRKGKCAGKSCRINPIGGPLVFRDVPGKLVQWRGHSQRFAGVRRALIDPPGEGVTSVPATPTGLRLLPAPGLAFRLPAGMLADSYTRIRPEPLAADRTRSLPGLSHGDATIVTTARPDRRASVQNAWVNFGEHRWVNSRERRRIGFPVRPRMRLASRAVQPFSGFRVCSERREASAGDVHGWA